MTKTTVIATALMCCAVQAMAQHTDRHTATWPATSEPVGEVAAMTEPAIHTGATDTLALPLPPLTTLGTIARPTVCWPYMGWVEWPLHHGLNAQLSMAATIGLGHGGGHGFAQSVAMMYAKQLSEKLTLAAGAYYSHFNWGPAQFHEVGLSAIVGYKFDQHWEAYLFAQKAVKTSPTPRPLRNWGEFGNKIGAEVRYNFSPSVSIGMSVWMEDRP